MFFAQSDSDTAGVCLRGFLDELESELDSVSLLPNALTNLGRASRKLECYVPRLDRDLNDVGVFFGGSLAGRSFDELSKGVDGLTFDEKKQVFLCEPRWLSALLAKRVSREFPELCVLSLDAHAGALEVGQRNEPCDRSWARWLGEELGTGRFFQVGGRAYSKNERDWMRRHQRLLPCFEVDIEVAVRTAMAEIGDRPIYVSLDLDVLDPSFAPEVSRLEGFGVSYSELRAALDVLGEARVVGFDLAGLPRAGGVNSQTLHLAAEVLRDNILAWWS